MDKNHRLDAPNNESLSGIEQIDDRSNLSGSYPKLHPEWEGKEIISEEARIAKRAAEQRTINLTIRNWFLVIGILAPMPFILLAILVGVAQTYFSDVENTGVLVVPGAIGVLIWGSLSYAAVRKVFNIFYQHAIAVLPFLVVLLTLLAISAQAIYAATEPIRLGPLLESIFIVSGGVIMASIFFSSLLLIIWTSSKIGAVGKLVALITIMTLTIALAIGTTMIHLDISKGIW